MTPRFDYSRIVMAVVIVTGLFLLFNTVGIWVLTALKLDAPEGMDSLIGTALGYMGGILTSTKGSTDTQNVSVVNPPTDPVPVSDKGEV